MIDFENGSVFKLRRTGSFHNEKLITPLFVTGEEFIGEYQSVRDFVVFTGRNRKKEGFHHSALLQNTVVLNRNLWRSGY